MKLVNDSVYLRIVWMCCIVVLILDAVVVLLFIVLFVVLFVVLYRSRG